MPAVTSGKVLVTGANGYIAMWLVQSLLEQGFSVRGTVRSEQKAAHLRDVFKPFGDKLELVIVEDITKEGAFDEAVKGVDAIEHTASPFHTNAVEPDELIAPAVKGTTSVLYSALRHGASVKRIVVTSSCAAVLDPSAPRLFSEADWNESSIAEVRAQGRDATGIAKYRASKTLAERAAWEFYNTHKGSVGWDLVVLNPPFVFGPVLHLVEAPEKLNSSMLEWFHTVIKGGKDKAALSSLGSCWIDVRDLAEAHVRVLKVPEAGGERIIVSAGPFKWQDWVIATRSITSDVPAGDESYDPKTVNYGLDYDTSKAGRILGLEYRSMPESIRAMLEDFKIKGWWKPSSA
ncbi:NAD-P-binding protein [Obba rivulosa]|uniref:NAD-P-binding protein n=1 Tax=Obba rivulosa TaxID=1052685 RepID=A0A8E2API6_9APHY|nr:NAD-P-binding protein [Obba rivulosa]